MSRAARPDLTKHFAVVNVDTGKIVTSFDILAEAIFMANRMIYGLGYRSAYTVLNTKTQAIVATVPGRV